MASLGEKRLLDCKHGRIEKADHLIGDVVVGGGVNTDSVEHDERHDEGRKQGEDVTYVIGPGKAQLSGVFEP